MDLTQVLNGVAKQLRTDFEDISAQFKHRPSKGRVRERQVISEFLTRYLPGSVGISTGEIVSADGAVSPQTDVVLYEPRSCPKFTHHEDCQIFPVECIYGVIEVKSRLTSAELRDAHHKTTAIKQLPRTAYLPPAGRIRHEEYLFGRDWPLPAPVLGMIFAYDSIDLGALASQLNEIQKDTAVHQRVDSVWVLNRGFIVPVDAVRGIEYTPTPTTRMRAAVSENPLLFMIGTMQYLFQNRRLPTFSIRKYLDHVSYGDWIEEKQHARRPKKNVARTMRNGAGQA